MFLNVKAVSVLQSEEKHLHGLFEVPASHHLKRQGTRPYWPAGKQTRTRCPRDHHHVLAVMWSVPVGPWSTSLAAGFSKPRRPCDRSGHKRRCLHLVWTIPLPSTNLSGFRKAAVGLPQISQAATFPAS